MTPTLLRGGAFLALLLAGQAIAETPFSDAAASSSYRLQPGDVVDISVWKEENLTRQVLIRSDGGISFPLVGDLSVEGSTIAELQIELERRLRNFISDVT